VSRAAKIITVFIVVVVLLAFGAGIAFAAPTTPTNSDARRYTAAYVHANYGKNLYVQVSADCPVFGSVVRRCYYRVPPQVYARGACGFYQPFGGYVRVWVENGFLHGRQSSSWCLQA